MIDASGGRHMPGRPGEIFEVAPCSAAGPAFQARPILHFDEGLRDWNRGRRNSGHFRRKFFAPFEHLRRPLVPIHPVHERSGIGGAACRNRFHFFQDGREFFLVEFPVEIQTKEKICEGDLLGHLQVLREAIGALEFVALDRIGEEGAQGTGPETGDFGKALEGFAGGSIFLRIGRADLENGEIELVEVVCRFLFDRGGEMLLDAGIVTLGAREPAGDNMVGRLVPVVLRDAFECAAGGVELAETKRGGGEI